MRPADLLATALALQCVWGVYSTVRSLRRSSTWSWKHERLLLVGVLFCGSCAVCAVSLWAGGFRAWMVAPLGVSYLWMIPMPCYFETVDRIRSLHAVRNLLFAVVGIGCIAIAVGLVPLSSLGL